FIENALADFTPRRAIYGARAGLFIHITNFPLAHFLLMAAIFRSQLRTENFKIILFNINYIGWIHAAGRRSPIQKPCRAFTNIGVFLEGFPTGLSTGRVDFLDIGA
ncbi:MAG: hypothetical protein QF767_14195, partial [Alphaproteobacteria bacterium]|nr:hypothetical protein [Alphaproteobacteria bacterium]